MSNFLKLCITVWVFGFALPTTMLAQETITEKKANREVTESEQEMAEVFKKYTWLRKVVDPVECSGEAVSVHSSPNGSKWLMVNVSGKRLMYHSDGSIYCTNSESLKCEDFYELQEASDSWICQ